jgi:hypothetical protein
MPLYLVTCVCDEGVWETSFKVIDAESRSDIARAISRSPDAWMRWLHLSKVWRPSPEEPECPPPEELLRRIDSSTIDGDSTWAFRIHEVTQVEHIPPPVG